MIAFDEKDRLLTVQEASHILGRRVSTLRKDIFLRAIPVVRIGQRQVRIPMSAIKQMVASGYRPAATR